MRTKRIVPPVKIGQIKIFKKSSNLMLTSGLMRCAFGCKKPLASKAVMPIVLLAGAMLTPLTANAQSGLPTFTCEADAYNFFGNPTNVQRFDPASLSVLSTIPTSPSVAVNGIGFNPLDNYIYGVITNANGQSGFAGRDFARVGVDGSVESLGQVQPATTGLPAFTTVTTATGTMDASGNWYGISANHIFTVNVGNNPTPGTLTYTAVPRTGNNTVVFDIAFSPSDGLLYGSRNALVRLNPATGASSIVSTTGANPPSAGGAWSTSDGTLYFYNNGGGVLYSVDVTQPTPVVTNLGSVPSNGTFDSAACLPPTITKGIVGAGPDADGNFSYEFTISNAFTSPIFVKFGDPLPGSLTYNPGSLSPANPGGGTVTEFTSTNLDIAGLEVPATGSVVFQVAVTIDPNAGGGSTIENQAVIEFGGAVIGSDDPGTGAPGDGTVLTIPAMPSLSLVKQDPTNDDEDGSTTITVGDTLNYTITATNDGNTVLTNVVVSDPLLAAPNNTITCSSLAVGETCELVGAYNVTAADETAGMVDNTASVVSDEVTTPAEASVSTPVALAPETVIDAADNDLTGTPITPGLSSLTASVFDNDTIDGAAFAPTDVTATITDDGSLFGATLNPDGTIDIPATIAPGIYQLVYEICDINDATNCDTATVTIAIQASTPDAGVTPSVCGDFLSQGWITHGKFDLTDAFVDFGSGDFATDPYLYLPMEREADGRIRTYFGAVSGTDSGTLLTPALAELATSQRSDAGHISEIHVTAYRLEGAPGSTVTADLDTRNGQEHTAYWIEDTAGNVIDTSDFQFTSGVTSIGGVGEVLPVSFTAPADGIAYLKAVIMDPSAFFGKPIISNYECPAPSLSMTKVAGNTGPYKAGDVVTYTYTVVNDGDTTIRNVAITDTHNGSDPAPVPGNETLLTDVAPAGDSTDAAVDGSWDLLAPGDTVTFTGTYTITQIDAETL